MVRIPGFRSAPPTARPAPAFARGAPAVRGSPLRRRLRLSLLWLGGAAVGVLLYSSLTGANGLRTYLDLRQERLRLEREVAELQRRRAEIETGLVALRDTADTETLERIAREKYRMRRPQEKVIEIVGEDALAPAPEPTAGE
ncbi:MAG: septum formation initiator family protein [bacterium]|nr:septum formation initiator family protein [bacterium]